MGAAQRLLPLLAFALNHGLQTVFGQTDVNTSLVESGKAFWLCRNGAAGVACGKRREPSLNDSGVLCSDGLCCSRETSRDPFTCGQSACADSSADEDKCSELALLD